MAGFEVFSGALAAMDDVGGRDRPRGVRLGPIHVAGGKCPPSAFRRLGILLLGGHLNTAALRAKGAAAGNVLHLYYLIPHLEWFDVRDIVHL